MILLMTKHSRRHRAAVVSPPSSCNYKTPPGPWATYCSFSSTLLWPTSDASADMFTLGAVIHSTLCSSCQSDRVMLRFHLSACWSEDYNYPDWILAEVEGVTSHSINTGAVNGQVSRHKR